MGTCGHIHLGGNPTISGKVLGRIVGPFGECARDLLAVSEVARGRCGP